MLTRRAVAGGAAAAAALAALHARAARPTALPQVPGWFEAVAIVSDLSRTASWLAEVAGWIPVWRGPSPRAWLDAWALPAAARGRELLLGNPGDLFGRVRLVELSGVGEQRRIRSAAMPWDTGGLFSLMTRSRDAWGAFRRHQWLGWDAYQEPADFPFGPTLLRNVVLRGPDGINLAVYERVRPLLEGWPTITRLSAPFNAMAMVRSRDAARAFWAEAGLSLSIWADGVYRDPAAGPSNFAIPQNLVTSAGRPFAIQGAPGAETGRVESMQFEGLAGRDCSALAHPPNLGLALLRFRSAQADGPAFLLPPYGSVRARRMVSPDGVVAELVAPA